MGKKERNKNPTWDSGVAMEKGSVISFMGLVHYGNDIVDSLFFQKDARSHAGLVCMIASGGKEYKYYLLLGWLTLIFCELTIFEHESRSQITK